MRGSTSAVTDGGWPSFVPDVVDVVVYHSRIRCDTTERRAATDASRNTHRTVFRKVDEA
jgi:hypothetical protein